MKLQKSSTRPKRTPRVIIRRVIGDSMLPTLRPGQIIIGRRKAMQAGDVVVFAHSGYEKIKRITSINDDSMSITGDNPSASTDSNDFGQLPIDTVIAVVIWPRATRVEK